MEIFPAFDVAGRTVGVGRLESDALFLVGALGSHDFILAQPAQSRLADRMDMKIRIAPLLNHRDKRNREKNSDEGSGGCD